MFPNQIQKSETESILKPVIIETFLEFKTEENPQVERLLWLTNKIMEREQHPGTARWIVFIK